ncbi:hypothetical protein D3C85_681060 [compost metagenome]
MQNKILVVNACGESNIPSKSRVNEMIIQKAVGAGYGVEYPTASKINGIELDYIVLEELSEMSSR